MRWNMLWKLAREMPTNGAPKRTGNRSVKGAGRQTLVPLLSQNEGARTSNYRAWGGGRTRKFTEARAITSRIATFIGQQVCDFSPHPGC